MKKVVITCKVLYREVLGLIEDTGADIDVELLPQGLHNLPDSTQMMKEIQGKIDALEEKKEYDHILLAYGYCSGGVEGLKTKRAQLVIPRVHDCIPLLLGGTKIKDGIDGGGNYYLSAGWIDCGGDTYKRYLYLAGKEKKLQAWIERFNKYQQEDREAVVDWYEKERYKKLAEKGFTEEMAKYVSYESLKNYQSITLIDNGNLASIHYDYAEAMHNFINDLLQEHRGTGLDYEIVEGEPGVLKRLIFFEELETEKSKKELLFTSPGESLKLQQHILTRSY